MDVIYGAALHQLTLQLQSSTPQIVYKHERSKRKRAVTELMSEHNGNFDLKIYPYLEYYTAPKDIQFLLQVIQDELTSIGLIELHCALRKWSFFKMT